MCPKGHAEPPAVRSQLCRSLHEIIGDRVEVVDRIADRLLVADAQHPYVHLLRQIRGIGLAPDAPLEKRLQGPPVLGKQPLDQGWFRVSHSHRDA